MMTTASAEQTITPIASEQMDRSLSDMVLRVIRIADILTEVEWDDLRLDPALVELTTRFAENTERVF